MIILLFIIASIYYHYAKHRSKLEKTYCRDNNRKIKNNEFKKVYIKNGMCYYFGAIFEFEDFDFDNIVIVNEKSNENILIYNISCRALIDPKTLRIDEFISLLWN